MSALTYEVKDRQSPVAAWLGATFPQHKEIQAEFRVAAGTQQVLMPAGVAPRCSLLPVRVLGAMRRGSQVVGAGSIDNIDVAAKWAVDQKVDVINMSLGVLHEGGGLPHAEVVAYAARHGVTVVAASGNDGQNAHYYPAGLPHVIVNGVVAVRDGTMTGARSGQVLKRQAPSTKK